jgi:alpha-amylase
MRFLSHWISKAPKYYIIKWLTDYITEYGIDGYRGDTVKHTDETVWADSRPNDYAFETWKKKQSNKSIRQQFLYTIAEVYNYGISGGQILILRQKINYFKMVSTT